MTQLYLSRSPHISEGISADSSGPQTKAISLVGEAAFDISDAAANSPCSLSFVDVYHPDENELDLSDEDQLGFGMRRSELNPTEFHLFWERFIKFWPRRTFHVKRSYQTGFCERKRKNGKSLSLFDAVAVEYAERHLCHVYWGMWKSVQSGQHVPSSPIWLGLHMPKKTTVDAIDFDAKQYLVGYYGKGIDARPLVHLPLEHFQTLKRLYDAFPGRMWCISSETLGIHAWRVHEHPVDSLALHHQNKRVLANIGLPTVEAHPMPGRCFRRPFGYDYRIITPDSVLDCWLYQVEYFEFDRRTPSFPQICEALIEAMLAQQENWNRADKKSATSGKPREVPKKVPHLKEIREWLAAGCPLSPVVTVSVPEAIPQNETDRIAQEVFLVASGEKLPSSSPLPAFSPDDTIINWQPTPSTLHYRNGQWTQALRTWAKTGLVEPDSVGTVVHEMAKWLYWVELFQKPDSERKKETCSLLTTFVMAKHNGFVSRLLVGKDSEVKKQVKRCVDSAIRLQSKDRELSLTKFANIRRNLADGEYKYPLRLVPILTGEKAEEKTTSSSSLSTSFMCIRFAPETLPQNIIERIKEKAGRRRILPFAAKLISFLVEHEGAAFIARDTYCEMLGYKNPTRLTEYLTVLAEAGVITRGNSYSAGRNGKQCSLLPWVLQALGIDKPMEAPETLLQPANKMEGTGSHQEPSDLIEGIWERVEPVYAGVGGGLCINEDAA
jgi:hypothetical protein